MTEPAVIDELGKGVPEAFRDDDLATNVYVDQIAGVDTNDGLSPSTALKTLDQVRRDFGVVLQGITRIVVNILNSTAAQLTYQATRLFLGGGNMAIVNTFSYRGPAMIQFSPSTGPATAGLDATPATRIDQTGAPSGSGNRTKINFATAAPGWIVGDLAGSFCRFTRGADKVFHEFPIVENGADFFIVDTLGIVGTLLSTDTAEIVEPAVVIVGDPAADNFALITVFGQSSWDPEGGFIAQITNGATFERLTIGSIFAMGSYGVNFDRCQAAGGFFAWHFNGGSPGFVNCAFKDVGLALIGTIAGSPPDPRNDSPTDPLNPGGAAFGTDPITGIHIAGGPGFRGGFRLGSGPNVLVPRGAGQFATFTALNLSVYGAVTSGIDVRQGSQLVIDDGATVQGSGNAHYGLRAKMGGVIRIPGGAAATITGTLGDTKVGRGPGIVAAYGTAAGALEEVAGHDGNLHDTPTTVGAKGDYSRITTEPTFEA
jgi:hypothetical protein